MADDNQPPEDETTGDQSLEENPDNEGGDELSDEWAAAMEESGDLDEDDGAEPAPLEELEDDSASRGQGNSPDLDVILDIPVTIAMEVGRTDIAIRNLLQLNQGSVIELDRLAGEPLDVLVNGTLIAHGEVVMVNEKFGIRLTDVVSQQERISRLNQ